RAPRAILMVDAMKSITANALRYPLVWSWVDGSFLGHVGVKGRIKHGDLRNATEHLLDDFDSIQSGGIVERRKCGHAIDRRLHSGCDERGRLVFPAAVHDAMAHNVNFRRFANGGNRA